VIPVPCVKHDAHAGITESGRLPLRAVAGGVVPLRLRVTRRLTCCRCLPCLRASQTALAPAADPLAKPGLHHSHLLLL